jgi:hypothetical protein
MWLGLAIATVVAAVLGHAILSRSAARRLNMVARFILVGLPLGLVLWLVLVLRDSTALEVLAALLGSALACELYIFAFTFVSSSVTVSLLLKLAAGPANWRQLDGDYSDAAMVGGRFAKLSANGLIVATPRGYVVTARGAALVSHFDRLRRFFRHTRGDAAGALHRPEPIGTRPPAGQHVR